MFQTKYTTNSRTIDTDSLADEDDGPVLLPVEPGEGGHGGGDPLNSSDVSTAINHGMMCIISVTTLVTSQPLYQAPARSVLSSYYSYPGTPSADRL